MEIMEFQKILKNGLPVRMIPLMAEDAHGTLNDLKERVAFLSDEQKYSVNELSQATRFGAKSFIDNMGSDDL